MEECVGKKDTFDNKAFLEMFKVVHIEACGIRGREARDVASVVNEKRLITTRRPFWD